VEKFVKKGMPPKMVIGQLLELVVQMFLLFLLGMGTTNDNNGNEAAAG
jgi:hypothetical protein